MCECCFARECQILGQLTGRRYHSTDQVLFRRMTLQRMDAGELFGAVWAWIPDFEVFLVDVSHQALFLHPSKATVPAAHDLCFVWTYYAVTGAQMFGKLGT